MAKELLHVMQKAPRPANEGVFAGGLGWDMLYQGVLVTLITLASYFIGHYLQIGNFDVGEESKHGTIMAFLTLAMCEVFHSFNMRSLRGSIFTMKGQNVWLWGAGLLSLLLTSLVVLINPIAEVFGMVGINAKEYFVAMGLGFLIIPFVEIVKFVHRLIDKKRGIEE